MADFAFAGVGPPEDTDAWKLQTLRNIRWLRAGTIATAENRIVVAGRSVGNEGDLRIEISYQAVNFEVYNEDMTLSITNFLLVRPDQDVSAARIFSAFILEMPRPGSPSMRMVVGNYLEGPALVMLDILLDYSAWHVAEGALHPRVNRSRQFHVFRDRLDVMWPALWAAYSVKLKGQLNATNASARRVVGAARAE